jgi:hypothetical protein
MLKIYDQMYGYAKTYITSNSKYTPSVIQVYPNESPIFPIVSIEESIQNISSENLSKGERKTFIQFTINVFSCDKTVDGKKISRETINDELVELVSNVFDDHYGMKVRIQSAPNMDTSIKRTLITCTADVDNEKLIIYRRN